jgi:isopentenyl phosphate kinase
MVLCSFEKTSFHLHTLYLDTIAEMISLVLRPKFVVFITDVAGIYNIPPHLPDAKLLNDVWVKGETSNESDAPQTGSGHEHDVTGGM